MSDSNLRPGGDVGIFLSLWDQLTCLDPVWTLCGPCVDPVWTLYGPCMDPILNRTLYCVIIYSF